MRVTLVRAGDKGDSRRRLFDHASDGAPEFVVSRKGEKPHRTKMNKLRFSLETMSHKIKRTDCAPIQWDEAFWSATRAVNITDNGYIHFVCFVSDHVCERGVHFEIELHLRRPIRSRALRDGNAHRILHAESVWVGDDNDFRIQRPQMFSHLLHR